MTTLFPGGMAAAAGAAAEPPRVCDIGISLTDEVKHEQFVELAREGGVEIVWGRHMIPGAPIRWLWGATNGFSERPYETWQSALREHEWGVVTRQPFKPVERGLPCAAVLRGVREAKSINGSAPLRAVAGPMAGRARERGGAEPLRNGGAGRMTGNGGGETGGVRGGRGDRP